MLIVWHRIGIAGIPARLSRITIAVPFRWFQWTIPKPTEGNLTRISRGDIIPGIRIPGSNTLSEVSTRGPSHSLLIYRVPVTLYLEWAIDIMLGYLEL
jgi:hypothetical protein